MIPPHTNRYPKPPSGAATGWGRFFCWGERAAAGGCGGVKTPPYRAKDNMGGNGKVEGRACPAPTGCPKWGADERGKGGRQPAPFAVGGWLPENGWQHTARRDPSGLAGSASSPDGEPFAGLRPRMSSRYRHRGFGGTPDSKVEEGAGALRTKSNTAFV